MSTFSLTKGSESALAMLARQAGSETLLLTQPARELRASINIEPFTSIGSNLLHAELFVREQRHSMTLQRDDGANAQHLADWVEAAANGTLDTAQAIPQRAEPAALLPCCKCGGEAIGYDYAIPGRDFRHGVKCRHRACHRVEGAATGGEAHTAWNDIQRAEQPDHIEDARPMVADQLRAATEMINHPPHYTGHPSGVECIEVAELLPFTLGNAFKYVFRHRGKGGLEDLRKARWYLQRDWEREEGHAISIGNLQLAAHLAQRIAAHEGYLLGAALVAVARNELQLAIELVDQLIAAA